MKLQIVNRHSKLVRRPYGGIANPLYATRYTLYALFIFALLAAFCAQTTFAEGYIIGWGEQVVGVDLSSGFVKVAAGGNHSLGLKQDGSIVAWGANYYGQCNIPSPNSGFIAISASGYHSLAIKVCQYKLTGDLDDNCRVGWADVRIFTGQWLDSDGSANLDGFNSINSLDFALLADNWLIDCNIDPGNPACVQK